MAETRWRRSRERGKTYSTADAAEACLIETGGGISENALHTAENAVLALARLVDVLHEQGKLSTDDVQKVLELYTYEVVE